MKKLFKIGKRITAFFVVILLNINSYAAVGANDGSAFVTKAEFDALVNTFNEQMDTYQSSIVSKIDGAIANYLAGLSSYKVEDRNVIGYVKNGVVSIGDVFDMAPNIGMPYIHGKTVDSFSNADNVDATTGNRTVTKLIKLDGTEIIPGVSPEEYLFKKAYIDYPTTGNTNYAFFDAYYEDEVEEGLIYSLNKNSGDGFQYDQNYYLYYNPPYEGINEEEGYYRFCNNPVIGMFFSSTDTLARTYDMFTVGVDLRRVQGKVKYQNLVGFGNATYDCFYDTSVTSNDVFYKTDNTFYQNTLIVDKKPTQFTDQKVIDYYKTICGTIWHNVFAWWNGKTNNWPYYLTGRKGYLTMIRNNQQDNYYRKICARPDTNITTLKEVTISQYDEVAKYYGEKTSSPYTGYITDVEEGKTVYHLPLDCGIPIIKAKENEKINMTFTFESKGDYMVWLKESPFNAAPNLDTDTVEFTGGTKGGQTANKGNIFVYNPDNDKYKTCELEYTYQGKDGYLFLNFSKYSTSEGASGGGVIILPQHAQITNYD